MPSKRFLPLILLLAAVCVVYGNSLENSFHFDDFHAITENPAIRSLGNVPRILHDGTAFSVLPANQTYRPVVTASLALDYALAHGYKPFWFHLSTLLWFLVLLVCLYLFVDLLLARVEPGPANRWLALAVAGWFGLHPAMAETVNYVIQRGDLYCTLGCVAGLLVFARYPARRRLGLYLAPFALAMLSKPPAAVFPMLLLLFVYFFEAGHLPRAQRWRLSLASALPAFAATALLLWLVGVLTPKSYAPTVLSAADYRLTQPFVWLRYTGALFLPLHLNVDTDLVPLHTLTGPAVAGLLFAAVLLGSIVVAAQRPRLFPIAYGLLWFLLTQLPTSVYALSEVENDHRMFFSFPGLMLAVIWAAFLGFGRLSRRWGAAGQTRRLELGTAVVALVVLGSYAAGVRQRNRVWRDEASLWQDDALKSPRNGRGLMNYGLTRMNVGDLAGALALFERALHYTPNYPTLEIDLGIVNGLMADRGQPALARVAEGHFERALALAPADDLPHAYYGRWLLGHGRLLEATTQLEAAVRLNAQRPLQRDLLLRAYQEAGDDQAARALAGATLALNPRDAAAAAALRGPDHGASPSQTLATFINASLAAYQAGRFSEAIAAAQQALRVDARSAEAWNNVGAGLGALRDWDGGIAAEQRALALDPQLAIAANNLRWFQAQRAGGAATDAAPRRAADFVNRSLRLSREGRYAESAAAARQALQVDPGSAEAWNNIAAAAEAQGQWGEAIDAARRAVALRPDFQLARNNLAWSLAQRAAGAAQGSSRH